MNFVTVDNDKARLEELARLLENAFSGCVITEFTDPLLSAKFILNNDVDMVLIEKVMRPVDGGELQRVLHLHKPGLKTIILSAPVENADGAWTRPITEEKLRSAAGA